MASRVETKYSNGDIILFGNGSVMYWRFESFLKFLKKTDFSSKELEYLPESLSILISLFCDTNRSKRTADTLVNV